MKRGRWILTGLVVALAMGFIGIQNLYAAPEPFKIGVICDLTGPTAGTGIPTAEGFAVAVKEANARGGIGGRNIELITEDGKYDLALEQKAFRKLVIQDGVHIAVTYSSGSNLALKPFILKEKIPTMVGSSIEITPLHPWMFLPLASPNDSVKVLVDYIIKKTKNPRIGVVFPDNEYGHIGRDTAREQAAKHGVKIIAEEVLNWKDVEATSQVLHLISSNVDHVILQGTAGFFTTFLKDAQRLGLKAKSFTGPRAVGSAAPKGLGEFTVGLVGVNPTVNWDEEIPEMKRLRELTKSLTGSDRPRTSDFIMGYIEGRICIEAFRIAGNDISRENIRNSIEKIRDLKLGITSPINFSPTNHKGADYLKFYQVSKETQGFESISDWIKPVK